MHPTSTPTHSYRVLILVTPTTRPTPSNTARSSHESRNLQPWIMITTWQIRIVPYGMAAASTCHECRVHVRCPNRSLGGQATAESVDRCGSSYGYRHCWTGIAAGGRWLISTVVLQIRWCCAGYIDFSGRLPLSISSRSRRLQVVRAWLLLYSRATLFPDDDAAVATFEI